MMALLAVVRTVFRSIDPDGKDSVERGDLAHALREHPELIAICDEAGLDGTFHVIDQLEDDPESTVELKEFSTLFYAELLLCRIYDIADTDHDGVMKKPELAAALRGDARFAKILSACVGASGDDFGEAILTVLARDPGTITINSFLNHLADLLHSELRGSEGTEDSEDSEESGEDEQEAQDELGLCASAALAVVRTVFRAIDTDADGVVSERQLCGALRNHPELVEVCEAAGLNPQFRVLDQLDERGDGVVTLEEFVALFYTELLLCSIFDDADTDHDGKLSREEVHAALYRDPRFLSMIAVLFPGTQSATEEEIFTRLDLYGEGAVSIEDFLRMLGDAMRRRRTAPESVDGDATGIPHVMAMLAVCKTVFKAIDTEGNGFITKGELYHALTEHPELVELCKDAGVDFRFRVFEQLDADGDGAISLEEFSALFYTELLLCAVFDEADTDHDGTLSRAEVHEALVSDPRFLTMISALFPGQDSATEDEIFNRLDLRGDGQVTITSFLETLGAVLRARTVRGSSTDGGVESRDTLDDEEEEDEEGAQDDEGRGVGQADTEPRSETGARVAGAMTPHVMAMLAVYKRVFRGIDAHGKGYITRKALRTGLTQHPELLALCREAGIDGRFHVLEQLDHDGDGMITLDNFAALFYAEIILRAICASGGGDPGGVLPRSEIKAALVRCPNIIPVLADLICGPSGGESIYSRLHLHGEGEVALDSFLDALSAVIRERTQQQYSPPPRASQSPQGGRGAAGSPDRTTRTSPAPAPQRLPQPSQRSSETDGSGGAGAAVSMSPHVLAMLAVCKTVFKAIDSDVNGFITKGELYRALAEHPELVQLCKDGGVDFRFRIFEQLDKDGDGVISLEEFTSLFYAELLLCAIFDEADTDHNGTLSRAEVLNALRSHPRFLEMIRRAFPGKDEVTFEEIYSKLSLDGEGEVSIEAFLSALSGLFHPADSDTRGDESDDGEPRVVDDSDYQRREDGSSLEGDLQMPHVLAMLHVCKTVFRTIDTEGHGYITKGELYRALNEHPELVQLCQDAGLDLKFRVFEQLDSDGDGKISLDEFSALFYSELLLCHIFDRADTDHDGSLTKAEIGAALRSDPRFLTMMINVLAGVRSVSVDEIFDLIDVEGEGHITINDFLEAMMTLVRLRRKEIADADAEAVAAGAARPPQPAPARVSGMGEEMGSDVGPHVLAMVAVCRTVFRSIDRDGKGYITKGELLTALHNHPELVELCRLAGKTVNFQLFQQLDRDGNGKISMDEFAALFYAELMLCSVFDAADEDHDGFLSKNEVASALKQDARFRGLVDAVTTGPKLSDDQIYTMLDLHRDGKVTIDEFMQLMLVVLRAARDGIEVLSGVTLPEPKHVAPPAADTPTAAARRAPPAKPPTLSTPASLPTPTGSTRSVPTPSSSRGSNLSTPNTPGQLPGTPLVERRPLGRGSALSAAGRAGMQAPAYALALVAMLRTVYKRLDPQGEGSVMKRDLLNALTGSTEFQSICAHEKVDCNFRLFENLDRDGNSFLPLEAAVGLFYMELLLTHLFNSSDTDADGLLTKAELRAVLTNDVRLRSLIGFGLTAVGKEGGDNITDAEFMQLCELEGEEQVSIDDVMTPLIAALRSPEGMSVSTPVASSTPAVAFSQPVASAPPAEAPSKLPNYEALADAVHIIFASVDTDEDGVVSRAELQAALKANPQLLELAARAGIDINAGVFEQLDANKDGVVTVEEFAVLFRLELLLAHVFDTADTNHDGLLTKHELSRAVRSDARLLTVIVQYCGAAAHGGVDAVFALLDLDKDGNISAPEFISKLTELRAASKQP